MISKFVFICTYMYITDSCTDLNIYVPIIETYQTVIYIYYSNVNSPLVICSIQFSLSLPQLLHPPIHSFSYSFFLYFYSQYEHSLYPLTSLHSIINVLKKSYLINQPITLQFNNDKKIFFYFYNEKAKTIIEIKIFLQ